MSVFIRACSGLGYSLTALLLLLLTSSLLSRVPSGFPETMAAPTGRPRTSFRPQIIAANPGSAGPADLDQLLRHTLPHFHIDPDRIPPAVRQKIAQHLHDYTVLHRQPTQAMLRRAAPYLRLIKRILHQHGLPAYFAYIPMAALRMCSACKW